MKKTDIRDTEDVRRMVEGFYEQVLKDETLGPLFIDTAGVDLSEHLPRIHSFWAKLLLGIPGYSRHTMNIHRRLHSKRNLREEDFARWLQLFRMNIDAQFVGENAERAKYLAATIAENMQRRLRLGSRQ